MSHVEDARRAGAATAALTSLLTARQLAKAAGAPKLVARINAAISSARGARAHAFNRADRSRIEAARPADPPPSPFAWE